jgi:hypothetical protein
MQSCTKDEFVFLLIVSANIKAAKYAGYEQPRLQGRNIALIFEKNLIVLAVGLKSQPTSRVPSLPAWD